MYLSLAYHSLNSEKCIQPYKSHLYEDTEHLPHRRVFLHALPSRCLPHPSQGNAVLLLSTLVLACSRTSCNATTQYVLFCEAFSPQQSLTVSMQVIQPTRICLHFFFFKSRIVWSVGTPGHLVEHTVWFL